MSLRRSLSQGLLGLMLMLLGLFVLVSLAVLLWAQFESLDAIEGRLEAAAPWLTVMRISLIAAVVATWPHLVTWWVTDPSKRAALLRARWRLAGWLVILEITLGQGLVGAFIAGLMAPGA